MTSSNPLTGPLSASPREPDRVVGRLAVLVRDVVARLDAPSVDSRLDVAVAECNTALEVCLELQRELADREDRVTSAKDDLERLGRLLVTVDRADAAFIMRQIRRVLGRFDLRDA